MNRPEPKFDDQSVIAAVLGGDTEKYAELVLRYQQRLINGVARMIGCLSDAEDVVQDAFVQAFCKLESFRSNSSFYTWLYRIAINTAINFCRRQNRITSLMSGALNGDQSIAGDDESPSYRLELSEQAREVQAGLDQLSDEHRHILVLREIDDLSYEDIADILELPIGTVRSRLHRARLQLRDYLISLEETKSTQ